MLPGWDQLHYKNRESGIRNQESGIRNILFTIPFRLWSNFSGVNTTAFSLKGKSVTRRILSDFLNLFFPDSCYHCGRSLVEGENILCSFCLIKLPLTHYHEDQDNEMISALQGRVNLEFAAAYLFFRKSGITQELLHQLKYKGRHEVGLFLGEHFGPLIREHPFIKQVNYLIPVPLHRSREKERGYNQSRIICDGLSKSTGIPVAEAIRRVEKTASQTRKHRFERWDNVSGKFALQQQELIQDQNVLIVDDVFTTGATIEACCETLKGIVNAMGIATLAMAR